MAHQSMKVEYIFLNRSLFVFNQDLTKLSELVPSFSDEECSSIEDKIKNIKTSLLKVEEKIKTKVL